MKCSLLLVAILPLMAQTGTTILDDKFADGNSQNQDLDNNSVWLFNGRTNNLRIDSIGAVTLDVTPAGASSEAVWAFFTKAGSPVNLGVGDKVSVSVTFSLFGFLGNGQDIRFGVLDSLGTRNTANLGGGHNDATFINDTGYGVQFYPSGQGSPFVLGRRAVLGNANMFNNFADFATIPGTGAINRQTLEDDTPYTLVFIIERLTAATTSLTIDVNGGKLKALTYSGAETNSSPNTSFDSFAFRIAGTNFASKLTFSRVLVQYTPAAPVITAQPQPSALTVQVGSAVRMAVGAAGSAINYQWQKDSSDIKGNDSAKTAVLNLDRVQLSEAGNYVAVIFNSGGKIVSDPVVLKVSSSPVLPAPAITRQPANVSGVLGDFASLSVAAIGNGLIYQWYKNGALLAGATSAGLTLENLKISDAASYYVVVSNSSGSISSSPASLLVLSPMYATSVTPWPGYPNICTDTPLTIDFERTPFVGKSGRIRVFDSVGKVVDTIDMASNPQNKIIGGTSYVYYPILITGRRVNIYLHQPLPLNDRYSVTIEPGVIVDEAGAPWEGFADPGLWNFRTRTTGPAANAKSLVVATDDYGDFCTLQSAIDFAPVNSTQPFVILVQPGTYSEINYVNSTKPFLTVRGADRDKTILQYANNANLNQGNSRAMFGVDATDFVLENITLWNTTPRLGSQAEAFRGNNRRILLNKVNLKSFQDTLLLQGQAMVNDSYIEGDVDFLWGNGTVFVQNSELRGITSGGFYTQIRNTQGQNGYVFLNSKLTAPDGVSGMYLSRIDPTVFPYSQVAYINCVMGSHILPAGWLLNNATTAPNVQFWEYRTTNLNGTLLDVSQRALFSRQLTAAEAAQWSNPSFVLGGWVPATLSSFSVQAKPGSIFSAQWTAPVGHSVNGSVGLYVSGAADSAAIARQALNESSNGAVHFSAPLQPGRYELRLFLDRGQKPAAAGHWIDVLP